VEVASLDQPTCWHTHSCKDMVRLNVDIKGGKQKTTPFGSRSMRSQVVH